MAAGGVAVIPVGYRVASSDITEVQRCLRWRLMRRGGDRHDDDLRPDRLGRRRLDRRRVDERREGQPEQSTPRTETGMRSGQEPVPDEGVLMRCKVWCEAVRLHVRNEYRRRHETRVARRGPGRRRPATAERDGECRGGQYLASAGWSEPFLTHVQYDTTVGQPFPASR